MKLKRYNTTGCIIYVHLYSNGMPYKQDYTSMMNAWVVIQHFIHKDELSTFSRLEQQIKETIKEDVFSLNSYGLVIGYELAIGE